jgi:hypothetical protein
MNNMTIGKTASELSGIRIDELEREVASLREALKSLDDVRAWAAESNLTAIQADELRAILEGK